MNAQDTKNKIKGVVKDSIDWNTSATSLSERFPTLTVRQRWLPCDSGRKVGLAQMIFEEVFEDCPVICLIENHDIWPSSCHKPLLARLRQALGEDSDPVSKPGYLFEPHEGDDAVSVMVLAALFFWDCLIVSCGGRGCAYISHDEFFEIGLRDPAAADKFITRFDETFGDTRPSSWPAGGTDSPPR